MNLDRDIKIDYYKARGLSLQKTIKFYTPRWIIPYLPKEKDAYILDIGCGQGAFIGDCIKNHKRSNVLGIDTSSEVIEFCKSNALNVKQITSLEEFLEQETKKYDFIYMSHVLEHLNKDDMIPILYNIRQKLLKKGGLVFTVVPNAQSSTNAYWAYEDFTHRTLFTTGSLKYVLEASGFDNIQFVDLDGFVGVDKKELKWRKPLLKLYKKLKKFEMWITKSFYHAQSPISYTWEIKAVGYNSND